MAPMLVLLAFVVGVAVVMGIYLLVSRVPGMMMEKRLDDRLRQVTQPAEEKETFDALVKATAHGPMPGLDRFLGGTSRGSNLARWIEQSGKKVSISGVLMMSFTLALALAFVSRVVTRTPWAMPIGFALGFALPFIILHVKRGRRMRTFEEQFPEALDLIARALKAGQAFATGL